MHELKLRRLTEHNARLRDDLQRPRVRVSEASARYASHTAEGLPAVSPRLFSLIQYCKNTRDPLVRIKRLSSDPKLYLQAADTAFVSVCCRFLPYGVPWAKTKTRMPRQRKAARVM